MVSNAADCNGPFHEGNVSDRQLTGSLGLLMGLLKQPRPVFEVCISSLGDSEFEPTAVASGGGFSSLTATTCWRALQGSRSWILERGAMLTLTSYKLLHDLMACHEQYGEVTEELRRVCQNLGGFIDQNEDLRGPAIAGLAIAAEELGAGGTTLPEYLTQLLREAIGEFVADTSGVPFG